MVTLFLCVLNRRERHQSLALAVGSGSSVQAGKDRAQGSALVVVPVLAQVVGAAELALRILH
jgi:hypothetical protein